MVSLQTNRPVLSGLKENFFQASGPVVDKKNKLKFSAANEVFQFSLQAKINTGVVLNDQNAILNFNRLNKQDKASLFYKDTPISELSTDKATALIQADGYFGINKTSLRIIDFVIQGSGTDIERLKAGREGVLRGFSEAEKAWGGTLPELSYKTMEKAIKTLDDKIAEMGGNPASIIA